MKFSVNWLREFVDLPKDSEDIADLLTRAGVETENIETRGAKIDKVIVSQITASSQHPNADRLSVCEVDDGSGTKRQIVCGATNYKVGDKVPLALPGAVLPSRRQAEGGFQIKVTKMRGVESEGMLCSAIELGLGSDAAGLLILSPEAKVGAPISKLFPSDTILDVEITPNRGDLLSHFGLAREIAALTGTKLRSAPHEVKIPIRKTGITITSTRECPFFSARRIEAVHVGPSPQWLRAKIESVGIRSINNIVDISNFVMLELGQPTHAFDADKLKRGVDPEMVLRASQRATELIQEIAGGLPAKEIHTAGKLPANPADVSFSYDKCDRVVGIVIKPRTVDEILEGFGLKKISAAKNMKWKVPSYRRDLQRDVDLIEEVVRTYGAEQIPGTDRSRAMPSSSADRSHDLESALGERLVARGLSEVRTSKLIPRNAPAFSENAIALQNPLSEDHVALRPSLLSGLLGVFERNVRAGAERVALFELGRVFVPPSGREERRAGFLVWGKIVSDPHWRTADQGRLDFFDLKGAVESVFPQKLSFQRSTRPTLSLAVEIYAVSQLIGIAGQLSKFSLKIDAPGDVFVAELSLDRPVQGLGSRATFREFGRFPAITRDIAMVLSEELTHEEILKVIFLGNPPWLERAEFFDQFVGDEAARRFGPNKKSLAYRLTYRDRSRTLTSEEVSAVHAKIRERLQRDLGAELRE